MGIKMVEAVFLLASKFSLHKPTSKYSSNTLVQIKIKLFHLLVNEININNNNMVVHTDDYKWCSFY